MDTEDHIGGVLTLARSSNMRHVTTEELEAKVAAWRSIHGTPPEIRSRDQALEYIGPELRHLDLSGMDLGKMDLRCVKLLHCNLSGASLNNASLDGAFLFGCDLSQIDSWLGSFRGASFRQCYIVKSRFIHGRFEGASFAHSDLENSSFLHSYHDRDTWFLEARLYRLDLRQAHLERVNLKAARTLFGVKLHLARLEGTEIDYDLFGGRIGEELDGEYVQAARTYSAIKANLEAAGDYAAAAKAYVKERQMEKTASAPWRARRLHGATELGDEYEYSKELNTLVRTQLGAKWWHSRTWRFIFKHTTKWLGDWILELLCSYGESVWRVLFWMGAMLFVLGPALIIMLGGLRWTGENQQIFPTFPSSFQRSAYVYFQYVLYTLDTFTTAAFAQLEPANDFVRLASGFMALLGIFLAGLLGFVGGNRIRHS